MLEFIIKAITTFLLSVSGALFLFIIVGFIFTAAALLNKKGD